MSYINTVVSSTEHLEHLMVYFIVLNKTLLFFLLSQMIFYGENPKLVMVYKNFHQRKTK